VRGETEGNVKIDGLVKSKQVTFIQKR